MNEILRTNQFAEWLLKLRDRKGRQRIEMQIDRLRNGNVGKAKVLGDGVRELRIDFGPGYRVYYMQQGECIYLLLAGSDKDSQDRAITLAKKMARVVRSHRKGV